MKPPSSTTPSEYLRWSASSAPTSRTVTASREGFAIEGIDDGSNDEPPPGRKASDLGPRNVREEVIFAGERYAFDVQEQLCEDMRAVGLTNGAIAARLGIHVGDVEGMFAGEMTLTEFGQLRWIIDAQQRDAVSDASNTLPERKMSQHEVDRRRYDMDVVLMHMSRNPEYYRVRLRKAIAACGQFDAFGYLLRLVDAVDPEADHGQ